MRNVFKWRIVTNKYLYLLDEDGAMPFIYNKITGERTYLEQTGDTDTTVVTGDTVDEGLIKEQASNIKQEALYCSKFNAMLELAQLDADASKLTFQSCDKYFNLDSEECVEEAVTPKCEGYEPVFHVSAYTLDDSSDVEYTVFAERNEADKTLRYNLNLGVPRGEKGERGSDGVGCQGAKGDAGLPAIIESVVAHATSAETATASVQMSKTGSTNSYAFTFNFGIPKGEQGPKGEDGYDGATGPGSRIYPITTSAISLEPGSDPTVNVTGNTRYNQRLNTYDTQLSLEFGIPEGYQGETGPDGSPAIIDDVKIDRIETLDADKDAYVNASVEKLGSGNTYLLHFEFGIPRGESTSGGTGCAYYDFDQIIVQTTSGAIPYFVLHEDPTIDPITGEPGLRIWYEFYYPERWGQGGGGTDDIKHRYDEDVDSLSEGVQEIIDGDTYPYAVASGIRSHAEGINVMASGMGSHAEGIGRNMHITLTAYLRQHCSEHSDYSDLFFTISEFNEKLETSFSNNEEIYENAEINIIGSSLIMPSVSDAHYKGGKEWLADKEVIISNAEYTDDENSVISFQHVYIQYNQESIALEDVMYGEESDNCNAEINNCKITVNINVPDAKGNASHIEGCTTFANGDFSHAEGWGTKTGAKTDNEAIAAHAEGVNTVSDGFASHAEGEYTKSTGRASHAGGVGTIANQEAMTAIGRYNVSGGTNDLFVIGNGTDSTHRSNVLSVNGVTNKITLNNSGGIQKQDGGGNTDVWNTAGGVTSLTSFSPKNGEFNLTVDNQTKKIFEANQGTNTVFTITASGSTHVSFDNSSNTLTVTSTDTNTHRPIKINGTEILGDNTTPLNLSGGTNVILTTDNTGLVTINTNPSSGSVPVGCIQMYAGATAPDGWLLCQGQSIVKSTMGTPADLKNPIYDNLYDILATGTGAGGLKRIPDFQQRFPLGAKEDDFISREDKGTLRISVSSGAYRFEKPVNSPSPLTYIIDLREICATGYEFVKVVSASGTGNIYSAITVVTCTEKGVVTDPTVRNLQSCFNSLVITALSNGSTYEVDYYSTYPTDLGKTGGEVGHTLTEGELARHGHTLVTRHEKGLAGSTSNNFLTSVISSSDTDRSIISPSDSTTNTPYTTYAGNNNPHNNIPPYFAINYIIKY